RDAGERRDQTITPDERAAKTGRSFRDLADQTTPLGDRFRELLVMTRSDFVEAAGNDGPGLATRLHRAAVGGGVDAADQSTHHREPDAREIRGQALGHGPAVR